MGHKLTPVDKFFIDHHKEMGAEGLAKQIGCTTRTIYNYINANPGRINNKQEEVVTAPPAEIPSQFQPTSPPISMKLIGKRKHGNSAAVVMTSEMSEAADEVFKKGAVNSRPEEYIHIINPNKED